MINFFKNARDSRAVRRLLVTLVCVPLLCAVATAQSEEYPSKAVRMVVPFGPGTTTDTIARLVSDRMSKALGQSIIIENKAGAGGTIGTAQVSRSAPDGYTIIMGTVGTHAINKELYSKRGYDPEKDFEPIAFVGQTPTILVVGGKSPYHSVEDLGKAAATPPGITFSSAGSGTSGHLAGELLKDRLGGTMLHVPYKEGSMALQDVMSGQVQFMFYHPAAVLSHVKAGKLRAIGVSSSQRSSAAPDVASIAEQTKSEFDLVAWFMMYAPAGTPAPVMAKLKEAADVALADPDLAAKLKTQGVEPGGESTRDLARFEAAEIDKWAELVKKSGAKVN
ncbi:tripartite-type tricarboxylate transporter receptor subunit TctC [Advenella incenata]|uniref:Tripartite-type tricarboxylate transporter receptor subunit TctC n=1 Tax=Advenella incenata TaxID=267800 RepID=A0A4Q7VCE7_9BURK|nr:tripartite tricarboxylate transporter substrate binding protein [Advenella incenata]RZT94546.1 tripartite-type tricarboxylate transporter receptor subunit TctC [Advenella incenata]